MHGVPNSGVPWPFSDSFTAVNGPEITLVARRGNDSLSPLRVSRSGDSVWDHVPGVSTSPVCAMGTTSHMNTTMTNSSGGGRLAIMQPYLFPYLGYFQLIAAVDKFVFYDDVAFVNRGWINRNRILVDGKARLFTAPLCQASQNRLICEIELSAAEYPRWKSKFLRTIDAAYSRAPQFQPTRELLDSVLGCGARTIGELARSSVNAVSTMLGLTTRIERTSMAYENGHLRAQERILDICARERTTLYINPPGGRELYSSEEFATRGMYLRFIRSRLPEYPQLGYPFVPALSILDVLMFNPIETVRGMMTEYDLEP